MALFFLFLSDSSDIIYNRKTQKLYKFNKDEFLSKIQFIISNTQK